MHIDGPFDLKCKNYESSDFLPVFRPIFWHVKIVFLLLTFTVVFYILLSSIFSLCVKSMHIGSPLSINIEYILTSPVHSHLYYLCNIYTFLIYIYSYIGEFT